MKIPTKILDYIYLARLDRPIGIYLLYLPCVFGVTLSYSSIQEFLYNSFLFFIGSVFMRSAGCIINDLIDRELDIHVERTRNRPIACGKISIRQAFIYLFIFLLLSVIILIQLNYLAIIISLASVILVLIYPLMKRFTYWPQAFLGITFNIGTLVAYTAITERLDFSAIVLYIGGIFWTLGYDTIYAFMDAKDDLKIGIKSSAIAIKEGNYRLIISVFYIIFITCVIISTYYANSLNIVSSWYFLPAIMLLVWQPITLDIKEPQNCLKRFKSNQYVGALIAGAIFIARLSLLENSTI